jgi:hypothetical protein
MMDDTLRVARFILVKHTKNGEKYTKWSKWLSNIPNGHIIYLSTFSIPRTSEIFPKLGFFWFEKHTIWQPWKPKKTSSDPNIIDCYVVEKFSKIQTRKTAK